MRGLCPDHRDLSVIDSLDADVGILSGIRRVGSADDLVLAGLGGEAVAHLETPWAIRESFD